MSETKVKRASFTRTLQKICSTLDKTPAKSGDWTFFKMKFSSTVEAKALWVVGSYARGAEECGDLDLVLDFESDGEPPTGKVAAKILFGNHRRVSVFAGTPEKNESCVSFDEAVLVWKGKDLNWESALANIKLDPNAKRYSRPADSIPLRPEQLNHEIDHLLDVAELEQKGHLEWSFKPLDELAEKHPSSESEKALARSMSYRGKKTQELLPFLLSYLDRTQHENFSIRDYGGKSDFYIDGSLFIIGKPYIPIELLDNVTLSELVLVPHKTARGPNGFWSIKRGAKHPLRMKSKSLSAFTLRDNKGRPLRTYNMSEYDSYNTPTCRLAKSLELFSTKAAADEFLEEELEILEEGEPSPTVSKVKGTELLELISCFDIIFYDNNPAPITHAGGRIFEDKPVSSLELIDILKSPGSP